MRGCVDDVEDEQEAIAGADRGKLVAVDADAAIVAGTPESMLRV